MKIVIYIFVLLVTFLGCSNPFMDPYFVTFEESIQEITLEYGEPDLVVDTYFYDDGTIRNRVVYWDVDPRRGTGEFDQIGREITYRTVTAEVWNQPYTKYTSPNRRNYDNYGWEIIKYHTSNFIFQ